MRREIRSIFGATFVGRRLRLRWAVPVTFYAGWQAQEFLCNGKRIDLRVRFWGSAKAFLIRPEEEAFL